MWFPPRGLGWQRSGAYLVQVGAAVIDRWQCRQRYGTAVDPPRQLGWSAVTPNGWLPPSTHHISGWRITPIWCTTSSNGSRCVGVTVLADPDTDLTLTAETWATLPIPDLVGQGPPPDRLRRAVEAYQAADTDGVPRAKAVAAELGIAETSASNVIVQARRLGLLPPTRPGVSAA